MTRSLTCRLPICLFLTALSFNCAVSSVDAADAEKTTTEGQEGADADADEEPASILFDLGEFRLREFRPTRNEKAILLFAIHLKLSDDTSEKTVERLGNWKQRLRSETLTAVRSVDLADYQAPGLERIQQVIRLRLNRLLPMPLVERIYITEFTVGDQ